MSLDLVSVAIHTNEHAHVGYSTDSALHALVSRIKEFVSKGQFAFDLVCHGAILCALYGARVEGYVLNLNLSLFCQREVVAIWNGAPGTRTKHISIKSQWQ